MRACRRRFGGTRSLTVDPAAFTVQTMRARIAEAGDPMAGMWKGAVSLAPRFEKLGLELPEE